MRYESDLLCEGFGREKLIVLNWVDLQDTFVYIMVVLNFRQHTSGYDAFPPQTLIVILNILALMWVETLEPQICYDCV